MATMIAKLVEQPDEGGQHLTVGQHYVVIGIEADWYRLLDDSGQPYLYDPNWFEIIDATKPSDWVSTIGDGGETYAYPAELDRPGFFEDYHNGQSTAIATFWQSVNRNLASAG